jgi:hypothetical protein
VTKPSHSFWNVPVLPCDHGESENELSLFDMLLADPGDEKLRGQLYDWCVDVQRIHPTDAQFQSWLQDMARSAHVYSAARFRARQSGAASNGSGSGSGSGTGQGDVPIRPTQSDQKVC